MVFGDIGTSPIYTLQTVFNPQDPHPVPVSTDNVLGVVSLVFWSVMIIVTMTYVLLAMRGDNDGEGGIMALITQLRRWSGHRGRRVALVLAALGIFGASLFFGESMITPAISVLSAVEGVKVVQPSLAELVVPATAVIIVALFLSEVTGRPITYVPETLAEARAWRAGAQDWEIDGWIGSYAAIATGETSVTSHTLDHLTGRPAMTLREFLAANPHAWAHLAT